MYKVDSNRQTGMNLVVGVLFLVIASFFLFLQASPARAVFGGTPVSAGKWPWMVALVSADEPNAFKGRHCGGSLIAPNRVLTAAHCVFRGGPVDFDVVVGRHRLSDDSSGERIKVSGISMHPRAIGGPFRRGSDFHINDVAILKLAKPSNAMPVKLIGPGQEQLWSPRRPAVVMGHGAFSYDYLPSDALLEGNLTMISSQACMSQIGPSSDGGTSDMFDSASMICAKDTTDPITVTTCGGDSGGPLVVSNGRAGVYQVGIVSWAPSDGDKECGPVAPDVFSSVPAFRSFITKPDKDLVFKPYNTSMPQISGTATAQSKLTCSPGRWVGASANNLRYAWLIDRVYADETTSTYTLRTQDIGKDVVCWVIGENLGGFHIAESSKVKVTSR